MTHKTHRTVSRSKKRRLVIFVISVILVNWVILPTAHQIRIFKEALPIFKAQWITQELPPQLAQDFGKLIIYGVVRKEIAASHIIGAGFMQNLVRKWAISQTQDIENYTGYKEDISKIILSSLENFPLPTQYYVEEKYVSYWPPRIDELIEQILNGLQRADKAEYNTPMLQSAFYTFTNVSFYRQVNGLSKKGNVAPANTMMWADIALNIVRSQLKNRLYADHVEQFSINRYMILPLYLNMAAYGTLNDLHTNHVCNSQLIRIYMELKRNIPEIRKIYVQRSMDYSLPSNATTRIRLFDADVRAAQEKFNLVKTECVASH